MKIFEQTLLEVLASRPCVKFFNRTLLEKFQAPPRTLLETREWINRTLVKIFYADLGCKKLTRSGKSGVFKKQNTLKHFFFQPAFGDEVIEPRGDHFVGANKMIRIVSQRFELLSNP